MGDQAIAGLALNAGRTSKRMVSDLMTKRRLESIIPSVLDQSLDKIVVKGSKELTDQRELAANLRSLPAIGSKNVKVAEFIVNTVVPNFWLKPGGILLEGKKVPGLLKLVALDTAIGRVTRHIPPYSFSRKFLATVQDPEEKKNVIQFLRIAGPSIGPSGAIVVHRDPETGVVTRTKGIPELLNPNHLTTDITADVVHEDFVDMAQEFQGLPKPIIRKDPEKSKVVGDVDVREDLRHVDPISGRKQEGK